MLFKPLTDNYRMQYYSQLIEATLLKRPINFLVEAVLQSKRPVTLRCPNLGPLTGCDILGTQLWFSAPLGDHLLPTLELVEVNGGFLVCINQELLKNLVIEGIDLGTIKELSGYKLKKQTSNCPQNIILTFLLKKNFLEQCYICLEHVIYANEKYEALFPIKNQFNNENIEYLMQKKRQGHRTILLYCVLHSGARSLKFIHDIYSNKISKAITMGVEVIAYKANISTQEITLNKNVPIISSIISPNHNNHN